MKAGSLTEEITIERAISAIDEYGTPSTGWNDVATVRAEKVEQSTREFIRNFGASDEELVIFRIRFLDGVTNADRVIWQGDAFNIREIAALGRRHGLELRCTRIPA